MTQTTVVLIRHGRTAGHAGNRYIGRTDLELNSFGEWQAQMLAESASGQVFTSLICSSMARTRATIAPVARRTGLPARFDDRLRELDFGLAEGRTLDELRAMDPAMVERFLADPVAGHFPEGEDPARAADRAIAAIVEAVSADPGGKVMVVTHNTLIRLVTCTLLGLPLSDYRRRLPRVDPCASVTLLLDGDGPPALVSFNVPLPASQAGSPAAPGPSESTR